MLGYQKLKDSNNEYSKKIKKLLEFNLKLISKINLK